MHVIGSAETPPQRNVLVTCPHRSEECHNYYPGRIHAGSSRSSRGGGSITVYNLARDRGGLRQTLTHDVMALTKIIPMLLNGQYSLGSPLLLPHRCSLLAASAELLYTELDSLVRYGSTNHNHKVRSLCLFC